MHDGCRPGNPITKGVMPEADMYGDTHSGYQPTWMSWTLAVHFTWLLGYRTQIDCDTIRRHHPSPIDIVPVCVAWYRKCHDGVGCVFTLHVWVPVCIERIIHEDVHFRYPFHQGAIHGWDSNRGRVRKRCRQLRRPIKVVGKRHPPVIPWPSDFSCVSRGNTGTANTA